MALIAAGQSSTVTGTLAGQIIMEGYLRLRINPVVRRLITRLLAIVPTFIVVLVAGDAAIDQLLIFSQVLLSMQLAFAVIPLIHFVSDRKKMGTHTISNASKVIAWCVAALIVALNLKLFLDSIADWMKGSSVWVQGLLVLFVALVAVLLLVTIIYPFMLRRRARNISVHGNIPHALAADDVKPFRKIALALDYGDNDLKIIHYAMRLADSNTELVLVHVVESVSARMMGAEAHDYEARKDQDHIDEYVKLLKEKGYPAVGILGFRDRSPEIARIIKETNCDLLVIGSHGHKAAYDWLFGETVNSVRHLIEIPVFIAR